MVDHTFVDEVFTEMKREERMSNYMSTHTTCYKCSQAKRTEIILTGDKILYEQKDKIKIIHDLAVSCDKEHTSDSHVIYGCTIGDKDHPDKCSTCRYAKKPIEVTKLEKVRGEAPLTTISMLYGCKHPERKYQPKEYNVAYFCCDHYMKKE